MGVQAVNHASSTTTRLRKIGSGARTRAGWTDGAIASGGAQSIEGRGQTSEIEGPESGQTRTRAAKMARKRTVSGIGGGDAEGARAKAGSRGSPGRFPRVLRQLRRVWNPRRTRTRPEA